MRTFPRLRLFFLLLTATLLLPVASAEAYVGPGLGVGTLTVVLGVIGSILLAVFAVAWYPLKRMLKRRGAASRDGGAKA